MIGQKAKAVRWSVRAAVVSIAAVVSTSFALGKNGRGAQLSEYSRGDFNLTIRVYTFIDVPPDQLSAAEAITSRVFRKTGVELTWVECPMNGESIRQHPICSDLETATEIHVNIVKRFAKNTRAEQYTMGYAIPLPPPDHGDLASISYMRAKQIVTNAPQSLLPLGELLGCGMAHEIGHLLLGPSHSPSGLMSGQWNPEDLRLASRNQLNFSGEEAASIRGNVYARMSEQGARQWRSVPRNEKSATEVSAFVFPDPAW